jgi:hypothetical protein
LKVFETIFEGRANFLLEAQGNPFRAVTHYHEEGKKETSWSCSSTHLYAIQGWKDGLVPLTVKDVRDNLKTKGKDLLKELLFYLNSGGAV